MKTRCRPGDRCVIVGDVPGAECNIGAEITVTALIEGVSPPAWEFKDASRPVKMVAYDVEAQQVHHAYAHWVTHSDDAGRDPRCFGSGFYDHHLVPKRDDPSARCIKEEVDTPAPAEVATA